MMQLTKRSKFDISSLRSSKYFESLTEQAFKRGLINDSELTEIKVKLLEILGEVISGYTCGSSSSVMKDIAEKLADGVVYHISAYLKSLLSPDDALEKLKTRKLSDMRLDGIRITKKKVATALGMLQAAKKIAVSLPCGLYNDALSHEIYDCITCYDYVYLPCESGRAFDYPTAHDSELSRLHGIEFYINYLSALICENKFCCEFPAYELSFVYSSCSNVAFSKKKGEILDNSIFNIYTAVLLNSVFCEYMRKEYRTLKLSVNDCEVAEELLCKLEEDDFTRILNDACKRLRAGDTDYNLRTLNKNMKLLRNAVINHSLTKILSITK